MQILNGDSIKIDGLYFVIYGHQILRYILVHSGKFGVLIV